MNRRECLCYIGCGSLIALNACSKFENDRENVIDKSLWDISVCGLNCAKCKLRIADKCGGCRGPVERNWSPKCEFRPCAEAKGHRYCFECAEFPCDKIEAFASDGHDHHRLAVENMKRMKELGLERWIAQQEKPMFCAGWIF